jgi:hypothetical protein
MTKRFEKKPTTTSANEYRIATSARQRASYDSTIEISSDKTSTVTRAGQVYYTGVFSKCFTHNDFLEPAKEDIDKLNICLESGESEAFAALALDPSSVRKLVSPQASLSFNAVGQDPFGLSMPAAPSLGSETFAAEMIELYGMALLRDESFSAISSGTTSVEHIIDDIIADLAAAGDDYKGPRGPSGDVDRSTLFRGLTAGDKLGPYVSQFLLHDVKQGQLAVEQTVDLENDTASSITQAGMEDIQNGVSNPSPNFSGTIKRISTARALASYVHNDPLAIAYFNAALILLKNGCPQNTGLPTSPTEANFATFGPGDLLAHLWGVANSALRVAWRQKWCNHLRLRPEVASVRVHNAKAGEDYGISSLVLNSATLTDAFQKNTAEGSSTYFLSQVYPEGSPAHPAYPAGHAVVSGACCTLLKAFFNGSTLMSSLSSGTFPIVESVTGDETMPQLEESRITDTAITDNMTVDGELNKLASNIANGRNMAGVHYRSDGDEGIILGEKVAISYLRDLALSYNESGFTGFKITKLDGNIEIIK